MCGSSTICSLRFGVLGAVSWGTSFSVIIALPITLFFVHVFGMNGVSFTVIVAYGVGALVMALYLLALVRRGLREESR